MASGGLKINLQQLSWFGTCETWSIAQIRYHSTMIGFVASILAGITLSDNLALGGASFQSMPAEHLPTAFDALTSNMDPSSHVGAQVTKLPHLCERYLCF